MAAKRREKEALQKIIEKNTPFTDPLVYFVLLVKRNTSGLEALTRNNCLAGGGCGELRMSTKTSVCSSANTSNRLGVVRDIQLPSSILKSQCLMPDDNDNKTLPDNGLRSLGSEWCFHYRPAVLPRSPYWSRCPLRGLCLSAAHVHV